MPGSAAVLWPSPYCTLTSPLGGEQHRAHLINEEILIHNNKFLLTARAESLRQPLPTALVLLERCSAPSRHLSEAQWIQQEEMVRNIVGNRGGGWDFIIQLKKWIQMQDVSCSGEHLRAFSLPCRCLDFLVTGEAEREVTFWGGEGKGLFSSLVVRGEVLQLCGMFTPQCCGGLVSQHQSNTGCGCWWWHQLGLAYWSAVPA